jgi:hypothetical protein
MRLLLSHLNPINGMTSKIYQSADHASGLFLLLGLVFAPWPFGTTLSWSIGVMNSIGFLLIGLVGLKALIGWKTDYKPTRCRAGAGHRWPARTLAVLTVVILGYVLLSAINSRALIHYAKSGPFEGASGVKIEYLNPVPWLPQSYDRKVTLRAF